MYEEVEVKLYTFWTLVQIVVSGQLHNMATLLARKELPVPKWLGTVIIILKKQT
jgi:hypothetical protein